MLSFTFALAAIVISHSLQLKIFESISPLYKLIILLSVIAASIKLMQEYAHGLNRAGDVLLGSWGEKSVEKILDELLGNYYYTKNHLTTQGDIDFILVGPQGVFTLEVKTTRNERRPKYWWQKIKYQHQAKAQARYICSLLKRYGVKTWVIPVIIFSYEKQNYASEKYGDVEAINENFLAEWLDKKPVKLNRDEIVKIHEILYRNR